MEELDGSELGTKEYWQDSYATELKNYKECGDVGEIWFDEDSQIRITNWILETNIPQMSKIIDIGCGNGMFLIELCREGYQRIDYSLNAITLASSIATDQNLKIDYKASDILDKDSARILGKFDVVHDKGTYDAISLHPENPKEKRENYIKNIGQILEKSGYFIITSCNWTEDELIKAFESIFIKYQSIKTPTFRFGGKVGSVVTSVVFKHKEL